MANKDLEQLRNDAAYAEKVSTLLPPGTDITANEIRMGIERMARLNGGWARHYDSYRAAVAFLLYMEKIVTFTSPWAYSGGCNQVSLDSVLFECGGQRLQAMHLVNGVRKVW